MTGRLATWAAQRGQLGLSVLIDATTQCQLRCGYCYFGPKGTSHMDCSSVFSTVTALAATFDGKVRLVRSHFMGGEPLLAWDSIRRLNGMLAGHFEARGVQYRWSLTSNLLALDEAKAATMKAERAGIHCSLDGLRHVQDTNRPYVSGAGSFDDVVSKVPIALSVSPRDTARVTVMPEDVHWIPGIADSVWSLGFRSVGVFPASFVRWPRTAIRQWGHETRALLASRVGEGRSLRTIVRRQPGSGSRCEVGNCGAGRGLWAVDTAGRLYPCHHLTRYPQLAVADGAACSVAEMRAAIQACRFGTVTSEDEERCRRCPAARWCTGGCWANEYLAKDIVHAGAGSDCLLRRSMTGQAGWAGAAPRHSAPHVRCDDAECGSRRGNSRSCSDECEVYECAECQTCMAGCEHECQEGECDGEE